MGLRGLLSGLAFIPKSLLTLSFSKDKKPGLFFAKKGPGHVIQIEEVRALIIKVESHVKI